MVAIEPMRAWSECYAIHWLDGMSLRDDTIWLATHCPMGLCQDRTRCRMSAPRGHQHDRSKQDPHPDAAAQPYSSLEGMAEVHGVDRCLGDRLAACQSFAGAEAAAKTCWDSSPRLSMSPTAGQPHRSPPRRARLD